MAANFTASSLVRPTGHGEQIAQRSDIRLTSNGVPGDRAYGQWQEQG